MKKDIFYTIPFMNNVYAINKQAHIIHKPSCKIVTTYISHKQLMVDLGGEKYYVARLMVNTFIGYHNGDILFKDGDKLNCHSSNLSYKVLNFIKCDSDTLVINGELFKLAYGYNNRYYLNEYGVLYDESYGFRKHSFSTREYLKFELYDDSKKISKMINRWVYETWIGQLRNSDNEVDHIDGNHWNNHYSNLSEVSGFENIQRSYDITKVRTRRWSKSIIESICRLIQDQYTIMDIMSILNIDAKDRRKLSELIHNIVLKKMHRDISDKYDLLSYKPMDTKITQRQLSEDDIKTIIDMHNQGMTDTEISNYLNVCRGSIYNILHGKSYKDIVNKIHLMDNEIL